jgi:hypothetical protein
MHAGMENGRKLFVRNKSAKWKAARERLGDRHNVRLGRESFVREFAACAAEARLDLVSDQGNVVVFGQPAGALPEFLAHGVDAALALNRFNSDGADGIIELYVEIGDIVESDKLNAGNQRYEGFTYLAVCVMESAPRVRP